MLLPRPPALVVLARALALTPPPRPPPHTRTQKTRRKASGTLRILHDPWYKRDARDRRAHVASAFESALQHNAALRPLLDRGVTEDVTPLRALELFRAVPDSDLDALALASRPEDLLLQAVPVPPVPIRPSVEMDGASNEDDVTMKLAQIVEVNGVVRQGLARGLPAANLAENWDFLQVQAAMLVNADLPGVSAALHGGAGSAPGRPLRGFVQRLKGKQGRFRGNLSGKRVDFSGRTVISPDPNLAVGQVCVPRAMAATLTYPERVTPHNHAALRQAVLNGTSTWPGANFVVAPDGARLFLRDERVRRRQAQELRVGHVVERHLRDGDVVLFNRQPSLHRVSIMAFRAVVRPGRTLRFNECVCAPFNADFDGDEMNLHLPQTEEARAEALELMGCERNLCTPKSGEILVAATQDFLTCAFLLTAKDRFLSRAAFCQAAAAMGDALAAVDLPPPALLKPVEMWTGKQLFGVLLRPDARSRLFVSVELPEREYSRKGGPMCAKDGYVVLRNGELLCGRLGKGTLGGSRAGLFAALAADFSPEASAAAMGRLAKLSARAMGELGFSIGIDDVTPKEPLVRAKSAAVDKGRARVAATLAAFRRGVLQPQPGCDVDQTLEASVTGELNAVREAAGKACMDTLDWHNAPLVMSQCGSKGSAINIAQMVACVGQQTVGGKRCANGFRDRTLPHFRRGERTPESKGFVENSFFSGLTPSEFFFHTMAGREGLVDTAVKTAETGYMSRRLMKALEDLSVAYDGTVRNAAGGVVQLSYGDDGMDPLVMEGGDGRPVDFARLLDKVRAATGAARAGRGLPPDEVPLPRDLRAAVDAALARPEFSFAPPETERVPSARWCSAAFRDGLRAHLHACVDALAAARARLGLPPDRRDPSQPPLLEYVAGLEGLTPEQLGAFVARCVEKYEAKRADAGGTVGAVGAQSIGEPGTQMTLKTFHFAGVASMNVTLGVPRIKEIINGSKNIATPVMRVPLARRPAAAAAAAAASAGKRGKAVVAGAAAAVEPSSATTLPASEADARRVKARLERTRLGQVAERISLELHAPGNGSGGGPLMPSAGTTPGRGGRGGARSGSALHPSSAPPAAPAAAFVRVVLDARLLDALGLAGAVSAASVKQAILSAPRMRLREQHVAVLGKHELAVMAPDPPPPDRSAAASAAAVAAAAAAAAAAASAAGGAGGASGGAVASPALLAAAAAAAASDDPDRLLFELHELLQRLPAVVVAGIPTIERAVVQRAQAPQGAEGGAAAAAAAAAGGGKKKKDASAADPGAPGAPDAAAGFELVVEGTDLRAVMGAEGVDGARVRTNHVAEVERCLGIEAARAVVMDEIRLVLGHYGIGVDARHTMLLADCMTYRGEVLGITRFGIAKMKDHGVLHTASFERTADHLFEAGVRGRVDDVAGVSERIILGAPMGAGTGAFRLLHDHAAALPPGDPGARAAAEARRRRRPAGSAEPETRPAAVRPPPLLASASARAG